MGEYAEDRLEFEERRALFEDFFSQARAHRYAKAAPAWSRNDKTWTTREGEVFKLEEMTPRHRGNLVRYLQRKFGNRFDSSPLVKRLIELGLDR